MSRPFLGRHAIVGVVLVGATVTTSVSASAARKPGHACSKAQSGLTTVSKGQQIRCVRVRPGVFRWRKVGVVAPRTTTTVPANITPPAGPALPPGAVTPTTPRPPEQPGSSSPFDPPPAVGDPAPTVPVG